MSDSIVKIRSYQRLVMPQFSRTILALMMREMTTSYGRSPGGYIWAIAEPVAGIALLTFIFSMAFQAPPIGPSFALFYASGLIPFLVYADVSNKLSQAINFSAPLLSYPRVTIADALLARALLNVVTQALVVCLVLVALLCLIDTQARMEPAHVLIAFVSATGLGFGVGALNCFLVTRFPVWQRIWSILNRPMFLLSCVVFTFESTPQPYQDWLWYNPIIHVVGTMRQGLYFGYSGSYISLTYVFFVSVGCSCIGLFLLWLYRDKLINR